MPGSSRLLDGQVSYFIKKGYVVYLLSPDHPKEEKFCLREGCVHLPVAIERKISPFADVKTIFQVIRHLRRVKPDIVNVGTPKMGLIGMLATWSLGIENRIYTCRGLRFESESGLKRQVLKAMEWLTVKLAKKVIYVGHSLRKAASDHGVEVSRKSFVVAKGSSNGVNLGFFNRTAVDEVLRNELLVRYGLEGKFVFGFVGRVSSHKGANELVSAFQKIYGENQQTRLIMMGHLDCTKSLEETVRTHPGIVYIAFQDNVPLFMSLFDVFVLPSWREGFSNASIQAAAMGLPVITSNATGCSDAIDAGFNGLMFPVKSAEDLYGAMIRYINDSNLKRQHSGNSLQWAKNFDPVVIWDGIEGIYLQKGTLK